MNKKSKEVQEKLQMTIGEVRKPTNAANRFCCNKGLTKLWLDVDVTRTRLVAKGHKAQDEKPPEKKKTRRANPPILQPHRVVFTPYDYQLYHFVLQSTSQSRKYSVQQYFVHRSAKFFFTRQCYKVFYAGLQRNTPYYKVNLRHEKCISAIFCMRTE